MIILRLLDTNQIPLTHSLSLSLTDFMSYLRARRTHAYYSAKFCEMSIIFLVIIWLHIIMNINQIGRKLYKRAGRPECCCSVVSARSSARKKNARAVHNKNDMQLHIVCCSSCTFAHIAKYILLYYMARYITHDTII